MLPYVGMKASSMMTYYFDCVECDRHRFTLDRLLDREVGWKTWWGCVECGAEYTIVKGRGKAEFEIERAPERDHSPQLALLRFRNPRENATNAHDDLYAIVETSIDPKADADEQRGSAQYYFEEHSCPTNFDIVAFIYGYNPDPHGMWEFLELLPMWRRSGGGGDTHEYLRHIRDAAPRVYERYFEGSLADDEKETNR